MNYFLAKTDPGTYSINDLERERRTVWDGVTIALALSKGKDLARRHEGLVPPAILPTGRTYKRWVDLGLGRFSLALKVRADRL